MCNGQTVIPRSVHSDGVWFTLPRYHRLQTNGTDRSKPVTMSQCHHHDRSTAVSNTVTLVTDRSKPVTMLQSWQIYSSVKYCNPHLQTDLNQVTMSQCHHLGRSTAVSNTVTLVTDKSESVANILLQCHCWKKDRCNRSTSVTNDVTTVTDLSTGQDCGLQCNHYNKDI